MCYGSEIPIGHPTPAVAAGQVLRDNGGMRKRMLPLLAALLLLRLTLAEADEPKAWQPLWSIDTHG